MKNKYFVLTIILISLILLFPGYPAEALSADKNQNYNIETFTIPNLDDDGSLLQKSKEELGGVVKHSKVTIAEISYDNFNKVKIEGNVNVGGNEKPFLINGTLKNCGDYNKNRIILVGQDVYNNFELMDSSFYYTTEWLTPFNQEVLNSGKNSVNTLYLLDKENRDFTFCEVVATGKFLEEQTKLIKEQDKLDTAEITNINWVNQVLKISETKVEEPNIFIRRQGVVPYTYTKSFTYLGDKYRDTLNFNLLITFSNVLPSGGITSGESRIQCLGGLFQNLNTGVKTNSYSVLGRSGNTTMEISIEGINKHGFTSSQTMGVADVRGSIKTDISYGVGIPNTGLTTNLTWYPGNSAYQVNVNSSGYYNNVSANKFTRSIKTTFDKGFEIHYSFHYFQTNFDIRDYGGRSSQCKVTAWYTLPFYNNWDGSTYTYRVGRTIWYD